MKFDDLKLKDRVFIDANIFIYNFGGRSLECKELLLKCAKNELKGNTSTLQKSNLKKIRWNLWMR